MNNPLYIIIGAYGSGKSEYSLHLAQSLNAGDTKVVLADLDIVNPYFRSRDVRESFAEIGIEVIAPEGQFKHADLPMLSPRIKGAIQSPGQTVILDVGGDPAGCRALAQFEEAIKHRGYEMLLVVNTLRPFTASPSDILQMQRQLEFTSKLRVTEYVCNTNLMEFTDSAVLENGIAMLEECSRLSGLAFEKYLVLDAYQDRIPDGILGKRRLVMSYTLKKPWELPPVKGI